MLYQTCTMACMYVCALTYCELCEHQVCLCCIIYIYTHTYKHTYKRTYANIYIYIYIYIYAYLYPFNQSYMHTHYTYISWSTRGKLRQHLLPLLRDMYGDGVTAKLSGLSEGSRQLKAYFACVCICIAHVWR